MNIRRQSSIISFALIALSSSCHRSHTAASTCSTTLYGYNAGLFEDSLGRIYDSSRVGSFDPTTFAIKGSRTVLLTTYNTGAYNSKDSCYYCFWADASGFGYGQLARTSSGGISIISGPNTQVAALIYNKTNNKFYCIDNTSTAIAELDVSDTTYTLTDLARPKHGFVIAQQCATATIDESTGAIYIVTGQNDSAYIEKYVPGATSTEVVAGVYRSPKVFGLAFNKNDNMLYAAQLSISAGAYELIKIDPATASVTTLCAIPFMVNYQNSTATFDPCRNLYIFSSDRGGGTFPDTSDVGMFTTKGVMVQHVVVPGTLEGLAESN
jgi:hypothetical protein